MLTTTPASPAPNAPQISCTVLIAAAAAAGLRRGRPPRPCPRRQVRPRDADAGTGDEQRRQPTRRSPAPVRRPRVGSTRRSPDRPPSPRAPRRPGARSTRSRLSDALTDFADASSRPPARRRRIRPPPAPCARCWPNSGTYMSTIVAAISSPMRHVHPLQRPRAETPPARQHRRGGHVGRRPGTAPPAPTPRASRPQWHARRALHPRDADRQRGGAEQQQRPHRDPRDRRRLESRAVAGRGSALGTSAAIATVMIASDPKAHRQIPNWANIPPMAGPTMTLDAPHRRHQRRRLGPQPVRQRGVDHRIPEAGEHSARRALHGAGDQQQFHGRRQWHSRACPRRTRQASADTTPAART